MAYVKHDDLCGAFKGIFPTDLKLVVGPLTVALRLSHDQSCVFLFFFADETLLAIRAPIGTQLEVPRPEDVGPAE